MTSVNKILVVDDEDMIRVNLEAFLDDEGFDVIAVATGEEAVEILRTNKEIQIAIVDLRLPGIDGNTVILEGNKCAEKVKYILHTGSSEYVLPQELIDIGIKEYQILFKPLIEMDLLLDLIERLGNQ